MNCPGSPRLSKGIKRKSSVYADEGTAAHMLAERCLALGCDAEAFADRVIDIHGEGTTVFLAKSAPLDEGLFTVDEEMVDGVQLFLDTVRAAVEPGDDVHIERRISFAEDMYGTADVAIYKPAKRKLRVFDLKYGAGVPVEVTDNSQLIYYGEGTYRTLPQGTPVDELEITIVQPRCPHPDGPVRSAAVGALELLDWAIAIQDAAERTRDPDAPLIPGDWCKWCPAAAICPANASKALAVAQADFDDLDTVELPAPEGLSVSQIAKVLDGADMLESWLKSVRQYAYAEAEAGRPVPGYKLVDKVGRRRWEGDEADIRKIVVGMGVSPGDVYESKFKSPAKIEKLVGKARFNTHLASLAPSVSSGTTLVPLSDKRPEVSRQIEDHFEDLEELGL